MRSKRMKIALAAIGFGLLIRAEPAGAEDNTRTFSLTIGHHERIRDVDEDKVDAILAEASKVLRKCHVVLKRKGHVGTFDRAPSKVENEDDRDAVHREDFDIKIVEFP